MKTLKLLAARAASNLWFARSRYGILNLPIPCRLPYGGWFLAYGDTIGLEMLEAGLGIRPYEWNHWRFVAGILKPSAVFFDVGANQGSYSILASRCVGSSGRVFAFEPSPIERTRLRRNLWMNRCRNVVIEGQALGADVGVTDFIVCLDHQGSYSSLCAPANDVVARRTTIRVPITTLDVYFKSRGLNRANFIKIDAEGAELAVLRGAAEVLASYRPVIMCEMADIRTIPWGYRAKEIYDLLYHEYRYRWFEVTESGLVREALVRASVGVGGNLIAIPEEGTETIRRMKCS